MNGGLAVPKSAEEFIEKSRPFLVYLKEWESALTTLDLAEAMRAMQVSPERIAMVSVDMINGFCCEGLLASERVRAIIPAIVALFQRAWDLGVTQFALVEDHHSPDAVEFTDFGAHAVAGTSEAQTVAEIASLPFAYLFTVVPKNSISPAHETEFDRWLESLGDVKLFIAVGNCTDLCLYQLAMHLKLRANARGLRQRIIVPADCAATYDMPVERAKDIGAMPHDGDLLNLLFLHHMCLNGVEVVKNVT